MENLKTILEDILQAYGKLGRIFLSEADFQLTLIRGIKSRLNESVSIVPEYPSDTNKRAHYDIYVEYDGKKHLIELKYRTAKLEYIDICGGKFNLKTQSAQDIGRHDFIADIERLEDQKIATGKSYCIMLTNDSAYYDAERYEKRKKKDTRDRNFRIHQEAKIKQINPDDKIDWYFKDVEPENRPSYMGDPLEIRHEYTCEWKTYCTVDGDGKTSEFKYLLLEIPPESKA